MTIKKNYKEKETIRERGKKRYLERISEEEEAEQEIKNYKPDVEEDYRDNDTIQNKLR